MNRCEPWTWLQVGISLPFAVPMSDVDMVAARQDAQRNCRDAQQQRTIM
jgi:hypothetical protein